MGRKPTVVLPRWLAVGARGAGLAGLPLSCALLGCDAINARPAQMPPPGANVGVVDPEAVRVCAIDDEQPEQWLPEDRTPPVRPVEYVKMTEWTPPPSVQALEAVVPPRGDAPPSYIQFPDLTRRSSGAGGTAKRRR